MSANERLARTIVTGLLHDMLGRRGFRQNWEAVDEDIRKEIVTTWRDIVARALDTARAREGERR